MATTQPISSYLNLSVLDGVRCITCISIIVFHVHFIFGFLFFPSSTKCMESLRNIPVISQIFLNVTFQMTMFWTISGFLCEYHLNVLRERCNGKLQPFQCGSFLLNRILRLYPLYSVMLLLVYARPIDEVLDPIDVDRCNTVQTIRSLLFLPSGQEGMGFLNCVGHLWSVVMDVHGYLAIVISSLLLSDNLRRYGLLFMYGFSLLYMTHLKESAPLTISREELDHLFSFGFFGLEYAREVELLISIGSSNIDPRTLYPEIDFNSEQITAGREARIYHYSQTHYTSILKHASAMLLGSFLFLNLKHFHGIQNRSTGEKVIKVLAIPLFLRMTSYYFHYSGIVAYLLLDVLLTLNPENSVAEKVCFSFFSNRFWSYMAPYTYGIYVVHLFVSAGTVKPVFEERARQILNDDLDGPCRDYNFSFILMKAVYVLMVSWALAFVLQKTIERPFHKLRYRLFKARSKETTTTSVSRY